MGVVAGVAIGTVGDTANAAPAQAPVSVIDRSYACATAFVGGIRQLEARAHSGSRAHSEWTRLPYAVVASGGVARTPFVDAPPENSVAWVTAGQPSLATTIDEEWLSWTDSAPDSDGLRRSRA
jgi:hypothetical protein